MKIAFVRQWLEDWTGKAVAGGLGSPTFVC